jgi:DNA-binding MarR family transcriptional regulator
MPDSSVPCRKGFLGLLHAAATVESAIESRLAVLGLSIPKLAALAHLEESGGSLPLGQLAERLACVKSNVTQLVDRLEADGLVIREADANDRRSRLAAITAAGRQAYEQGARAQREAEAELFAALSAQDVARLNEIVAKLDRVRGATAPRLPA